MQGHSTDMQEPVSPYQLNALIRTLFRAAGETSETARRRALILQAAALGERLAMIEGTGCAP